MPSRLPAPLFNFEWPLDSPELASPSSTRKRRSNSSPEAPQRSTEAIFNEIIHKISTIREFTELVYGSIPPEQGSLICRTFLESGVFEASNARANFNARTGTLWIRVWLTELHGVQFRWVTYTGFRWAIEGLMSKAELYLFDVGAGTSTAEVWTRNPAGGLIMSEKSIFPEPIPAPDPGTDVIQFTKLDLFGQHMVAGQDPNTVLALDLSDLRDFARERMLSMGMTPA
ncbi:hypothetical protein AARAC_003626 [Aspergillus arachidicola]|uniref:Uncharacterized protein n=1 Tax=Aspergillus arachidicola TaxID=656916 RepID=A0A2G7GC67_9EURO|nr:hypothetical protein AARAC_003626 [Aspergillus arachidicola]